MNLLLTAVFILAPLPLLMLSIRAGHLRTFPAVVLALAGVYGFMFLGSGIVIYQPGLYSDAFAVSLFVILAIFVAFYALVFGLKDQLLIEWRDHPPSAPQTLSLLLIGALWAYSGVMFALYTARHGLPALFSVNLKAEALDLYAIRAEKSTDLTEGMHWYKIGLQTVPILIFIYTYAWSVFERSRVSRLVFWCSLPIVLVMVNSFATKDGIVYIVEYSLLVGLVAGSLRLTSGRLWLLLLGGIGSIFIWLRIYLLDRTTFAVLQTFGKYLIGRTAGAYVEAHAYTLQVFPAEHSFFLGRAFGNPGGILPFSPIDFSRFLGMRRVGTISNYAAPSFSQGYANFGWLGLVLIGLTMCLQLLIIQMFFRRVRKNMLSFTLYIYVVGRMIGYGQQSIQSVISVDVVVVMTGFTILYAVCSMLLSRPVLSRFRPEKSPEPIRAGAT